MDLIKKNLRIKIICFVVFLIFLLVCTIVSRGIYAAKIPMVRVGGKERKVISETITSNVELEVQKEIPVLLQENLLVENITVSAGQNVKKGDLLMQVSLDELDESMENIMKNMMLEKQKLAEYDEENAKTDKRNADAEAQKQRNINDATERLNRSITQHNTKIADLEASICDVTAQIENHKKMMPDKNSTEYSKWEEKLETLQNILQEKQGLLEEAKSSKEQEIYTRQKELEREQSAPSEKSERQGASGRMEIEKNIEDLQKQLDELRKLKNDNGEIYANADGIVNKILIDVGIRTTQDPVIMIGDCEGGLYAKAIISEEQRKKITSSDKMELSFLDGRIKIDNVAIQSISLQENGTYMVLGLVDLNQMDNYEKPENGMLGEMSITINSNDCNCCVPLSALRSDGEKDYVLKLDEKDGFLGKQYVARRIDVTVKAKDDSYAGLDGDVILDGDEIILESDKEVMEDMEVRLFEDK